MPLGLQFVTLTTQHCPIHPQGYSCAHIWAHGDIEVNNRLGVVRPAHLGCKARPTPSAGRSSLDNAGCTVSTH